MSGERSDITPMDILAAVMFYSGHERIEVRLRILHKYLTAQTKLIGAPAFSFINPVIPWESTLRMGMEQLERVRIISKPSRASSYFILDEVGAAFIHARVLPLFSDSQRSYLMHLGELVAKQFGDMKSKRSHY